MSIASLQSIVDQMSTDDLVEALRDPPTAAKLRNALILAEPPLVEPKAGQEQVSAILEQDIERVASSMSNDDNQACVVASSMTVRPRRWRSGTRGKRSTPPSSLLLAGTTTTKEAAARWACGLADLSWPRARPLRSMTSRMGRGSP